MQAVMLMGYGIEVDCCVKGVEGDPLSKWVSGQAFCYN
jgi:hypothetical protein